MIPCLWALIACSEVEVDESLVQDSLGVEVVSHGALAEELAYTLEGPLFELEGRSEDQAWEEVSSGILMSDQRAVVADAMAREITILSAAGQAEATLGGAGAGPGEFLSIGAVLRTDDDGVVVVDPGLSRAWMMKGDAIDEVHALDPSVLLGMRAFAVDDGDLLLESTGWFPFVDESWVQGVVVRYGLANGAADTLLSFDFHPSGTEGVTPDPFRPQGWVGTVAGGILVTRGDRTRFERFDSGGRLVQVVRWEEPGRSVEERHWEALADFFRSVSSRPPAELAELLEEFRGAAEGSLPYSSGIRGDARGRVWVAEYQPDVRHPRRYRVFSRSGEFRGWVEMPRRFEVLDVGRGLVLGLHRNEFDVETVAVYRVPEIDGR